MLDNPQNRDFTFDDFKKQLDQIKKLGMNGMIHRMPVLKGMVSEGEDPESALGRITSIIDAMTRNERRNLRPIDSHRLRDIALASATSEQHVQQLLTQFDHLRALMRKLATMSMFDRIKMMRNFNQLPLEEGDRFPEGD